MFFENNLDKFGICENPAYLCGHKIAEWSSW
jgi:hypothetical protein